MDNLIAGYEWVTDRLDQVGAWLPALFLRLIMGYEYSKAGMFKFNGDNWFESVKESFVFPFNVVPVELSWFMATWFEILGGLALVLGLFTRFFAASLIILTIVAALAVHWPDQWDTFAELWKGYAISNEGFGNYKLPLLFGIMLTPLLFLGPGKLSIDHLIKRWVG